MDTQWMHVGSLDDIPVRGSRRIKQDGQTVALFRTAKNKVYAIADQCPHKAGPLSSGIVHDACVTCPLHNWVISLETGKAVGADEGSTPIYPVKIDGSHVLVALPKKADEAHGSKVVKNRASVVGAAS